MELLKCLSNAYANTTSLVSLYLPSGIALTQVNDHLNHELKTANNIKDKNTSKNVSIALKSIISKLKTTQIPVNGMIVFSGLYDMKSTETTACI